MDRDLLTTREAAELLGVGTTSVKRWADSGLLECVKTPGGHRRFPQHAVQALLRRHQPGAAPSEWLELVISATSGAEVYGPIARDRGRAGSVVPIPAGPLTRPIRPDGHGDMMKVRLGVSSCLLGNQVRFDGSHKRDRLITGPLATFADYVPVCPEIGAGMSIPRETVRLVAGPRGPRLLAPRSGTDWTEAVAGYSERALADLEKCDLDGFVLKSRSPTCGLERVKVYPAQGGGMASKDGVGVFARALRARMPLLPVEEEGRLNDPTLRETFLEAVFAHRRFKNLVSGPITIGRLVEFHAANKFLLHAHSPHHQRLLGKVVARARKDGVELARCIYLAGYMTALRMTTTMKKHVSVLEHMAGFFKKLLSRAARHELHESIDDYRAGLLPRAVPLALLRSHARANQVDYLARQTYFRPYPKQLLAARS